MHTQRTVLNVEAFDAMVADEGLTSMNAIGKRMGVAHTTVRDARLGGTVGHRFITAAMTAFHVPFERIFKVAD